MTHIFVMYIIAIVASGSISHVHIYGILSSQIYYSFS